MQNAKGKPGSHEHRLDVTRMPWIGVIMSLIKKVTVGALAAVGVLTLIGRGAKSPAVTESESKRVAAPRARKRAKRRSKPKHAKTS